MVWLVDSSWNLGTPTNGKREVQEWLPGCLMTIRFCGDTLTDTVTPLEDVASSLQGKVGIPESCKLSQKLGVAYTHCLLAPPQKEHRCWQLGVSWVSRVFVSPGVSMFKKPMGVMICPSTPLKSWKERWALFLTSIIKTPLAEPRVRTLV